jgi:glycosyltransferase involved in cell wall biosynthesis
LTNSVEISIVTVNLNNASGLKVTIDSVLMQNYKANFVIIDGGSNDGSIEILREYDKHISYWVSEKDSGIYNAMNKGIRHATGNYLMFLNSGDALVDSIVIEKCASLIESNSGIDILYGDYFLKSMTQSVNNPYKRQPEQTSILGLKQATLNHQAALFKKALFIEFGLYPEQFKIASDYWLFIVSILSGKVFKHIDLLMVNYNIDGISTLNYRAYGKEMALIWEQYAPEPIKSLVQENEELRKQASFRLIRYASVVNKLLQVVKRK